MHSTTNTSTKHILCSFEEILAIFDRKQKPFQHLHTFCNIFPSCSVHAPVPFIICLYIIIATWTSFESTKQNPNNSSRAKQTTKPTQRMTEFCRKISKDIATYMSEWMVYPRGLFHLTHTARTPIQIVLPLFSCPFMRFTNILFFICHHKRKLNILFFYDGHKIRIIATNYTVWRGMICD